jgi:hypothetical protein
LNGQETIPVSATPAQFWAASTDGSVAFFVRNGNLVRFTLSNKKSTTIATEVEGLLGTSADATRAYFISRSKIGDQGVKGEPNLYVSQLNAVSFIATLAESDVSVNSTFRLSAPRNVSRLTRVSDDGRFLAFTSAAPLTGHNNLDTRTGLQDSQVYLFEAESSDLRCISCNSSGARPTGRVISGQNTNTVGLAARIPPWKNQFHAARVLSEDGSHLYFESLEALLPGDVNGKMDVYEWQRA